MNHKRGHSWVPFAAALLFVAATSARAQEPRYDMAMVSDSKDSFDDKPVISTDAAKVYVVYSLGDVPKGAKLKAAWIAVDVPGQPKNHKFDQAETAARGGAYMGAFSIVKPQGGWPAGDYRVDLYIDGQLKKSVKFKIAKS